MNETTARPVDQAAVRQALPSLPPESAARFAARLGGGNLGGTVTAEETEILCRESGLARDQFMIAMVGVAALLAKVPTSGYPVGVVSLGATTGHLYFGANLEYPGRPLDTCVHAEQAATVNAWAHGESGLTALAASVAPCGFCRQFLWELDAADSLQIVLPTGTTTLGALLPDPFGPTDLGQSARLMQSAEHQLTFHPASNDAVICRALAEANRSYAPYTGNHSGAALQPTSGRIFGGAYAENAAYTPSLSPMAAAVSQMNVLTGAIDIVRAVLVQRMFEPPQADHASAASALVTSLASSVTLECYTVID